MKSARQHILLAEDDANFGMMLKIFLEMNGFDVALCPDGEQAVQVFRQGQFDLCILDVMMPLLDGFSAAEQMLDGNRQGPFVFLTAKGLKEDQVKGYQLGAADYLIKPFDPEILLWKIKVLLRRNMPAASGETVGAIGSYIFDYERRTLSLNGAVQRLSPKEAELLRLLNSKAGDVLLHQEALLQIWQNDDYFTKQSMNVFVSKLRKYLADDPEWNIEIENLHGKGIVLKQERKGISD